ncbi:MAG: hypothetical protein JWN72_251 [Thermoleophilia bacterium]|nr:hypothetical protein [Thermoleophilia bacterium]
MHRSRTVRRVALAALLPALAAAVASCGASSDERGASRARSREGGSAPAASTSASSTTAPTPTRSCTVPQGIFPAPTSPTGLATATRALAAATDRASRTRRPFTTDLAITLASGVRVRGRLSGVRRADGSSAGTLRWQGAARFLLPDQQLRIAGNQLAVRAHAGDRWRALGSASGVALDVGRELFTHPFLLDVTGTGGTGELRTVRAVARVADLRAYATTERQGLATELLAGATALRIDAAISRGTLTADVFTLRTRLPTDYARRLRSATVTIVGRTAACAAAR